jgi:hypothetical protein
LPAELIAELLAELPGTMPSTLPDDTSRGFDVRPHIFHSCSLGARERSTLPIHREDYHERESTIPDPL